MGKKKDNIFEGYGSDTTVVLESKPMTMQDLEDSMKKLTEQSSIAPDPPLLSPTQIHQFRMNFDKIYAEKYYAKCAKFMKYFHKEVVFQHVGSCVE